MNRVAKVLAVVGLLLVGVLGLGMSLCGGVFTVMSLDQLTHAWGMLGIAVPSLAGGIGLLVLVVKGLRRQWGRRVDE